MENRKRCLEIIKWFVNRNKVSRLFSSRIFSVNRENLVELKHGKEAQGGEQYMERMLSSKRKMKFQVELRHSNYPKKWCNNLMLMSKE